MPERSSKDRRGIAVFKSQFRAPLGVRPGDRSRTGAMSGAEAGARLRVGFLDYLKNCAHDAASGAEDR
jgi:hypothetical protein